ncbi:glycosyltransferase family 4 protein [Candidatus Magnetomonas plexicatena]|uniref:glycosyltransferase family 4 protein n=1 Tax=Candidatus Magnetomonas plexicatena TaxID=2552947 RepID=UPI001C764206|nr:glycosyltransferase [Nitrospirales bacterium LBB_01]
MKILHLSTYDTHGGASRAAYRIHAGLKSRGVESCMLVQRKFSNDQTVEPIEVYKTKANLKRRLFSKIEELPLKIYKRTVNYYLPLLQDNIADNPLIAAADIIHLHWILYGFVRPDFLLKLRKPVVWTVQDMWPFTGGCFYSFDCNGYERSCGNCPELNSKFKIDYSYWLLKLKEKLWKNINFTVVAPSNWLASCASKSALFSAKPIRMIPSSLDTALFTPTEKKAARDILKLPQDKKIVLLGAVVTTDKRKGYQYLTDALKKHVCTFDVMIFGMQDKDNPLNINSKVYNMGFINNDAQLSLIYSAADVFVVPSIQEAFGLVAIEAMACATPVVAFNATGLPDVIKHKQTGYLAQPYDADDLYNGILWVLEDETRLNDLSINAVERVKSNFTYAVQSERYVKLYEEILS